MKRAGVFYFRLIDSGQWPRILCRFLQVSIVFNVKTIEGARLSLLYCLYCLYCWTNSVSTSSA